MMTKTVHISNNKFKGYPTTYVYGELLVTLDCYCLCETENGGSQIKFAYGNQKF